MKSITLFTEEVDDLAAAVNDLLGQLEDFTLLTSSVGMLFVPSDVELAELLERLREKLDFPIAGATGMALLSDKCGCQVSGLSLQIMTADDCTFAVGITNGIAADNLDNELSRLCGRLRNEAGAEPKLIISYISALTDIKAERYMQALEAAVPGVPLFGGIAADEFLFTDSRVFVGTEILGSGVVVIMVSGEVRPLMHCEYSIAKETLLPGKASCADGMVVRIGERTLVEAMQAIGVRSEKSDVVEEFVGMPFVADMPLPDGDNLRLVRHLKQLDHTTGSGAFLGEIKEGTQFAISILDRDYLPVSVERALTQLLEKLEQAKDYRYSTLLCIACGARQMVLTGSLKHEGDAILSLLPGNLSLSGMYSFGEICPLKSRKGKEYNAFHNTAFTILAM